MRLKIFYLILLVCLQIMDLRAGLNKELNSFFDSFGSSSNLTGGDIYEGQKAGYATGGGLSVRNRVWKTNPVTIDLPSMNSGCGGIDIHAGGFSFINSDQLIAQLKNIGSNAVGYSFLLGMESVSPQITNAIKQLESWSNDINGFGINSCEVASSLVGAIYPKNQMASEHICRTAGINNIKIQNYISGRHDCADQHKDPNIVNELREKNIFSGNLNVCWQALIQDPTFADDKELAEHFMTLMGTIITREEGDSTKLLSYPSKIKDDDFLRSLLDGGTLQSFKCDEHEKCLVLKVKNITIKEEDGWFNKAKTILLEIQEKIFQDEELTKEQISFLEKSRLPLYKIVNVLSAYKGAHCPLDLYQVADIIAMDMLLQYLREASEKVRESCYQLRGSQFYATEIDDYIKELNHVEKTLRYYEQRNVAVMARENQLIEKITLLESQLASELILY